MQRAARILFRSALLLAGLSGVWYARRTTQVLAGHESTPAAVPASAAQGPESTLAGFLDDLAAFRRGDDERLPALRESGRELCRRWQRCDALDVAEYYARLDRAARLRGIEDEQRGLELRARARAAERAELDESAWQIEREQILAGLEELAASIPPSADRVPAAQAAALAAHLRVEHLFRAPHLGDLERAQELAGLDRDLACSEEVFVRAGMLRPRLELDWISGVRARTLERPDEARKRLASCLEAARTLDDRTWQERALQELHDLALEAGDVPRMAALIDELAALDAPELPWSVAQRYAGMLIWKDQPAQAAQFLEAHATSAGTKFADEFALLYGQCQLRTGDIPGALATYARIAADSGRAREARLSQARALLARGSAAQALALVESPEAVRGTSAEARGIWLTLHAEILLALDQRAQAIRELREALAGAAGAQARLFEERGANQSINVLGEVLGLHAVELLARAELEQGDALGAACTIEGAQSSTLRAARGVPSGPEFARGDLAAWARHFELGLVTWVVGSEETLVVHVAPDGSAHGARIAHGRRALQEAVRRLREAVLAGDERRRERLANELRSVLLPGTLSDDLAARAGAPSARLCCLLHGPLEALPIEALDDGAWLCDSIVPVVLPGLPANAPEAPWISDAGRHWQLLGDPSGLGGELRLPGAGEELNSLARLLPGSAQATGAAFGRESLSAALASGDCVHIATHVRQGGADARFLLSDDVEFDLDAIRSVRPHAPLVVLTGCETGGGRFADAEGLLGIARAFLESGTRNLVATNWPVEDQWARAFALALHQGLLSGLAPARACAEARRSLRAQGAPAAEWAAFRSIGQD